MSADIMCLFLTIAALLSNRRVILLDLFHGNLQLRIVSTCYGNFSLNPASDIQP
jgi:hypothetical protein